MRKINQHQYVRSLPVNAPEEVRAPAPGKQPRECYPKPTFQGIPATPEVCRAIRKVVLDHSFIELKPTRVIVKDTGPSKLTMLVWTLVIAGAIITASVINAGPRETKPVQTYSLDPRR